MKVSFWIMIWGILFLCSCGGKPHSSYRSNKYHPSIKHYDKVPDVTTEAHAKAAKQKKKDHASAVKYKKKQMDQLKRLNSDNKYRSSQKNDAIFYLY